MADESERRDSTRDRATASPGREPRIRASAPWFRALEEDDRFQDLLEHMGAIITEYDEEGRLVHVSSSVRAVLGFAPEDLVGAANNEFVHPDDFDAAARLLENDGGTGPPVRRTARHRSRHRSGHWIWLETSATRAFTAPDGTKHGVAFSQDVSGLKQAEDELRESEARYRLVVEASDDVVVESSPDGAVVFTTPNLGRTLGYTAEEMVALEPYATIHPDDLPELRAEFARALASEGATRLSYRARHRDGHWRHMQSTGVGYQHESGEARYLNVTRDVTDRVEAEQERIDKAARSHRAKRLESLGLMAGGIAHDFNNFLTPIMADASLTLADLPEDSPLRYRLERVRRTAQRAAELTGHMLAYAGAEEIDPSSLDLSEFVEETSKLLETALAGRAQLRLGLARGLPRVEGDSSQLTRVLMNLLTNAAEAMEEDGSEIVVRTGVIALDDATARRREDGVIDPGEYVYLEVEDNGCGMSADTQAHIFDPFFTTKFTGRGLGLASVIGILRAHGGAVDIDSRPGEGTRIRVLLPASETTEDAVNAGAPVAAPIAVEPMVLVIDDDEGTREVTRDCLVRAGLRVLCAADGTSGIETFEQHAGSIELVLLDRTMPGLSGEATFDRIRQIRNDAKIVLMSGYAGKQAAESFAGRALSGFIGKPFLPEALIEQVRKALAEPPPD
jgi:PAS domain S-box-containing protein